MPVKVMQYRWEGTGVLPSARMGYAGARRTEREVFILFLFLSPPRRAGGEACPQFIKSEDEGGARSVEMNGSAETGESLKEVFRA